MLYEQGRHGNRKLKISSRSSSPIKTGANVGNQKAVQKPMELLGEDFMDITPEKGKKRKNR